MESKKLDNLFTLVSKRYDELTNSRDKEKIIANLKSLARWNNEPLDYPEVESPNFPNKIDIADAVCHPECGRREFIVVGSTQKCQSCGGLMFRESEKSYKLADS